MNAPRRRQCLVLALALGVLSTPARARAEESVLEKVAVFDPTIRFQDAGSLTVAPQLQTRWTAAETGGPEKLVVAGFSVPRARIVLTTNLYDAFRFRLRLGTSSNGSAQFQQAYGEARWDDCTVRVGQLPLILTAAEEPVIQGLSTADFSSYAFTYAGGQTQGVEFAYRGPVRFKVTVGNGARSGFSELLSPLVASLATTGRFEVPIGPQGAFDYDSEASFRKNQPVNARLGATGHFQFRTETNSTPSNAIGITSADAGIRGSGFSVLASAAYVVLSQPGATSVQNGGLFVLGSILPARKVELFAQFDALFPLGARSPFPPNFAQNQAGTTVFRTMTLGTNFFIVPDAHRLKIQVDLQTMFDGQATSIVPPNAALGVLSATGPQVSTRVQLVAAL